MSRKKIAIVLIVILLLITSIVAVRCAGNSGETATDTEKDLYVPVEVEEAAIKTIANSVVLNGKIHTNDEAMILPKIPGKVEKVNVKLGDYVQKGAVLFVMDQKDISKSVEQAEEALNTVRIGVEQAENGVETAKINYNSIKERIENAKVNLERTRALYEAGAISKSQLEQAELAASNTSLEAAERQVRQAELAYEQALNQLSQAEISYRQAQDALDDTVVRAPISGVISSINVVEGELAGGAQPLAVISDINKVYLQVDVAENMVNILKEGQEVSIEVPAALDEKMTGKVDYISSTINPMTQLYMVKVYLNNSEGKIRTGMSGSITVDIEKVEDTLVVDSKAVIEKEGEYFIYIVEDDHAVEKKVKIGMDTGSEVEILEGIEEGDKVIVKGQHYITDGERVKIVGGE